MKKIISIFIIASMLLACAENKSTDHQRALVIAHGKFAFCGASATELTGDTIIINGKSFLEGCATCPVLDGPSIANSLIVANPDITPDSTIKTVWSFFWYYDSVPQAPTWENLPTVNRTFTITEKPGGGMSNMWCYPCKVLAKKVNGVTLAKCYGPINELAFPMRRTIRAYPGETSVTQAPVGASYPVGTIIPSFDAIKNK
jgi:hypothetical protein